MFVSLEILIALMNELLENVSELYVNLLRSLTCLRWGGVSGPRTYKGHT